MQSFVWPVIDTELFRKAFSLSIFKTLILKGNCLDPILNLLSLAILMAILGHFYDVLVVLGERWLPWVPVLWVKGASMYILNEINIMLKHLLTTPGYFLVEQNSHMQQLALKPVRSQ